MNDEPIFSSVGQALHVAFLMAIMPPTQRVSTQVLIDSLREQCGKTEARIASTINMGRLTPLEFRGQCALICASAHHHLTQPEYAAVRARFGHQVTKAEGVKELADYIQPATGILHVWAVRGIVWKQYHRGGQRARDRWSLRDIEKETGVTVAALRRCCDVVKKMGEGLELRAQARLGELFVRTGLVAEEYRADAKLTPA